MARVRELYYVTENVTWVCGDCEKIDDGSMSYGGCSVDCVSMNEWLLTRFRRIAINLPTWHASDTDTLCTMCHLALFPVRYRISELLLVVGDLEKLEDELDVVFIKPSQNPREVKHAISGDEQDSAETDHATWSNMENNVVQSMQLLKSQRAAERKSNLDCELKILLLLAKANLTTLPSGS